MSPDDPRHGTTAGHSAGCRLTCCREARNTDERNRRKRRQVLGIVRSIDNTGTVRRIQALWAIGWRSSDIARACGWSTPQAVTEIVATRHSTYISTAETVARAYEEMAMTPGPSAKNRRDAARKGWAPPLAWDDIDHDEHPNLGGTDTDIDPVVVDRLLAGERVSSTAAEKTEAMRQWLSWGRSEASLCAIHGWKDGRYVTRQEGAA